tara:strand:- start:165 stop:404 length:240 start_codon:yes stop_codon:yes gene_type:complete
MAKIKLDDVEYDTDNMSDNAKAQLASLQFNEAHINRLRNELAIADTAKIAYVNALKRELEISESSDAGTKSKSKKKAAE